MRGTLTLLAAALIASGCGEEESATKPKAQALTRDAVGHYCNMIVADHEGPKGQIFLASRDQPIWFSSVRDTIAFTVLPEEPKDIAAVYVNDMARATWEAPEPGTWIDARDAWYVIESSRTGGMGAPEAAPFSDRVSAEAFAAAYGGRVVAFADIPRDFILGSAETPEDHVMKDMPDAGEHGH